MVECKYKKEKDLLYTYEDDIHAMERSLVALKTGKCMSPALDKEHFFKLLDYLNVDLNGKTILNIGCGHGVLDTFILQNYDCNIVGVEFSPKRTKRCQKFAKMNNVDNKAKFINADIHLYLEKTKQKFDIILAFEVIEHLVYQKEIMKQIKGHLVPNGRLIGSVPIQPNGAPEQHIQPFETLDDARSRLDVTIFDNITIPLRTVECRAITWVKK